MATLPKATTVVQDTAGAVASGTDLICVLSPCAVNDDATPRLYGSAAAVYAQHGYCEGVEYAALHAERTRKPFMFIGLPIAVDGVIEDADDTGNTGDSEVTILAGSDGVLDAHDGVLVVLTGGTIGTDQIVLGLSLDGGVTFKRVRLGTATSYVLPYVNATVSFAAGDLVTGDTILTWHGTAPTADSDGLAAARAALAAQQKGFRSMLLCGDLQTGTQATAYLAQLNAYETANERFVYGRASVRDRASDETKVEWMADVDAEFAGVDDAFRIDLSAGRGRVLSPFSGWMARRPAGWFASIREYQHDLHVATWRKDDGPVGADLFDDEGNLVEWDDRVDGSAGSAARFTTLRTWANGPAGAFVTLSLTRGEEGSLLSLTHNVAVVNLACTVVHRATENVIGRSLVLNDDGTATTDSLSTIQTEVNAALELALLQNRGEGPRASKAVYTPSGQDILNVPEALLTGVLDLNLNGTVHSVHTAVRVRSGGQ